jgi:hypothetical protein
MPRTVNTIATRFSGLLSATGLVRGDVLHFACYGFFEPFGKFAIHSRPGGYE